MPAIELYMRETETEKGPKLNGLFRLMKEELSLIERNHTPKERSLNQLKSSLEAMQTTKEGLENELNQVREISRLITGTE